MIRFLVMTGIFRLKKDWSSYYLYPNDSLTAKRLYDKMRKAQTDTAHHAPRCPANTWCKQVLALPKCTCGARL